MKEILLSQEMQTSFREAWAATDVVCIDLEETVVTSANTKGYPGLLERYKGLNLETYMRLTQCTVEDAEQTLGDYRRRFNGRGELVYVDQFGSLAPWYDALSAIDPSLYIQSRPPISDLLSWIKQQGKTLVLVSNTPTPLVKTILATTGTDTSVFDDIVSWESPEMPYPKDDDGVRWGNLFNRYPGARIMTIGDSPFDYEPALRNGQTGVGVGPTPKGTYSFWLGSAYDIPQIIGGGTYEI